MSKELIVFFTSMIPFLDLKIAIPIGLKMGLSGTTTFIFAVAGAIIPGAIMLAVLPAVTTYLSKRSKYCNKILQKLFHKTRKDHTKNFNRYGAIFLIVFVGIPIPGSGAGAGSFIAFLFGVDYWKALILITIGTIISAFLVTTGFGSIFALVNAMS